MDIDLGKETEILVCKNFGLDEFFCEIFQFKSAQEDKKFELNCSKVN
jgi:hypothetical protein